MRIFCVGRNYVAHAKELDNEIPETPVIFMKPESAYLPNNNPSPYPAFSHDFHYETEIVLKINKKGVNIQEADAGSYFSEIGLGIDFTARDLQRQLIEKSLPWELCKSFDHSALVGDFITKPEDLYNLDFYLLKNGEKVQYGNTKNVIFSFEKLISFISQFFTLEENDLIFTGTPEGIGPVQKGDLLEGYINNQKIFNTTVI